MGLSKAGQLARKGVDRCFEASVAVRSTELLLDLFTVAT